MPDFPARRRFPWTAALLAAALVAQTPPKPGNNGGAPPSSVQAQENGRKGSLRLNLSLAGGEPPQVHARRRPDRTAAEVKAAAELALGRRYLDHAFWQEASQHCAAAAALDPALAGVSDCLFGSSQGLRGEADVRLRARLALIRALIRNDDLSGARKELDSLAALAPLPPAVEAARTALAAELAERSSRAWPNNLPSFFGLAEWLPTAVSVAGHLLFYVLAAYAAYSLCKLLRHALAWRYFRRLKAPVVWRVWPIADSTGQSSAGAVIDALNARFNPLFFPLFTSSFLAAPPALDAGGNLAPVLRNFLTTLSTHGARQPLSRFIENLDEQLPTRHVFHQVAAFEDMSVKLGAIEGSLGSVVRNLERWWKKGRPSVTGSVMFEDAANRRFASVRLVCNYGTGSRRAGIAVGHAGHRIELNDLFAQETTISVFASNPVDEAADAMAMAAQRAAFRLHYRLYMPTEPLLAIAASSYRQGVRLLNNIL